jgi:peptide/nickel transport system permease protein
LIRYVIKRLLMIIPTLLGVLLIIFTINHFIPGDPVISMLGNNFTEEQYQEKRTELGLDQPFVVQYVKYVAGVVTKLDLGTSYDTKHPVSEMIFSSRIGITLKLGLWSCLITVVFGVAIGILSAVKQYSPVDYLATTFAVIFSAAPAFWVALMAMLLFCLKIKLFPASWGTGGVRAMVLPVVCMALSPISLVARMTRTSMLDVIHQDYIRTARAKGVKERTVIFSHALRNAMIPVLTIIGAQLTMVVGGSFIIESIFSIPGIGMLLLSAINTRDFPVIQGTVLVLSFFVCVINLAVDVAYAYVDPRIKAQYEGAQRKRKPAKEVQS